MTWLRIALAACMIDAESRSKPDNDVHIVLLFADPRRNQGVLVW